MSDVVVLLPCRDEAATVAGVVEAFAAALPTARVHVFDNDSTDDTARLAEEAGAVVHRVGRPGKGNVVRRMFADLDADVYVMADGDGTYDAAAAPALVQELLDRGLDMVIGGRVVDDHDRGQVRAGHATGTRVFAWLYGHLFGLAVEDPFSGYRALTRRFVKSFPATSVGFEVETELLVHAAELQVEVAELPTRYRPRSVEEGSKLSTRRDGLRILRAAVRLYRVGRPLRFFAGLAALVAAVALASLLVTSATTLVAGLLVAAAVLLAVGFVGDATCDLRREHRRMAFLAVPRAEP